MTIRQTLHAVMLMLKKGFDVAAPKLKKALAAVGNGSDALWSQPAAGTTQPTTQKNRANQNIDSIWGTPADIKTVLDSPSGVDTAAKQTIPTEPPSGAGIPPALQAPQSTETPLGATPQKKNVRGKEPTLEDILPVPPGW